MGENEESFKAIGDRTLRATQHKIIESLKLDYDTFINSAYLRQGRADEFMLKRPSERKEVLAGLLGLDQYDKLAEEAKDRSRQLKGQVQLVEQNLESLQTQLRQKETLTIEISSAGDRIERLRVAQESERQQLQGAIAAKNQRQTLQQQLTWLRNNYNQQDKQCQRLEQEVNSIKRRRQELEVLLQQEAEIAAGYAQFEQLQAQEEQFSAKLQAYQDAGKRREKLQELLRERTSDLNNQLQLLVAKLDTLEQQEKELQEIISREPEVQKAMVQLQQARERVKVFDRLQAEAAPLVRRRQELEMELVSRRAHLSARVQEIAGQIGRLQEKQQTRGRVQQAVMEVAHRIEDLEKKRVYQQRVREKGLERRSFLERLQASQREYETRLGEIEQKIRMLGDNATCPLCDRPLDEHHWELVMQKHESQHQEVRHHLWVVRDQLAVSDREISVLRQEYSQLSRELADANGLQKQYGGLQAQLEMTEADRQRLMMMAREKEELELAIGTNAFVGELSTEVQQIEQALQRLNYDEKNHALARSDADRWRWAEIKQAQINDAKRSLSNLAPRRPQLEAKLQALRQTLEQEQSNSDLNRELEEINQELARLGYNIDEHNAVRAARSKAQVWLARAEQLRLAQQEYPQIRARVDEMQVMLRGRCLERDAIGEQIESLNLQLKETPDVSKQIPLLERQIASRRSELDRLLGKLGRLQQQQQHLEALELQRETLSQQLQDSRRQYRVYNELATAFGKKGIQALMIENVLPQLEAETNQILSRLSGNQLHVQFVTQRASKSRSKKNSKLIDTLDIVIADVAGTRAYETYSGGEAFRINFAIRLALAQLLCARQGTRLQMLIVDEGFGTQDQEGCERLIAAINAIAPEFASILIITHMPQFKEAFQARVEVRKGEEGSQLFLS